MTEQAPNAAVSGGLQGLALENAEEFFDEACELFERFDNGLTLHNRRLIKRYLDGGLNLLVEARWGPIDFYIVCHGTHKGSTVGDTPLGAKGSATASNAEALVWPDKKPRQSEPDLSECVRGPYRQNSVVFVEDVERVDFPEVGAPSLVWFQPKNESLRFFGNARYLFFSKGFVTPATVGDGKSVAGRGHVLVLTHKRAEKLVEGGSQVVNGVSEGGAKLDWNAFVDSYSVDILAGLRICLTDDLVRVVLMKSPDSELEILDVAFGPFEF